MEESVSGTSNTFRHFACQLLPLYYRSTPQSRKRVFLLQFPYPYPTPARYFADHLPKHLYSRSLNRLCSCWNSMIQDNPASLVHRECRRIRMHDPVSGFVEFCRFYLVHDVLFRFTHIKSLNPYPHFFNLCTRASCGSLGIFVLRFVHLRFVVFTSSKSVIVDIFFQIVESFLRPPELGSFFQKGVCFSVLLRGLPW